MQPLQVAALGFLLISLRLQAGGLDATPDPIGWLLVLLAVTRLPQDLPHRGPVLALGTLALVTSVGLALPGVVAGFAGGDPALAWAVSLPALAASAVLLHALTVAARTGDDPAAAGWLGSLRTVTVAVAVLPAVVLGAGVGALAGLTALLALVSALGLVVVLLVYARRTWAGGVPRVAAG